MHIPIHIKKISFHLPHKICFENFSHILTYGSKVALIGRNGSGKSTLLKMLAGEMTPSSGEISMHDSIVIAYVHQVLDSVDAESGAQRFNKALSGALSLNPDVLLLDEPTNHLDRSNRKALIRMLMNSYDGTLILASHDIDLLNSGIFDYLWHIDDGQITVFSGKYDDYMKELAMRRESLEQAISVLNQQKKAVHQTLMKEQGRAATSRSIGEKYAAKRKWPKIMQNSKRQEADKTLGRKKGVINRKKEEIVTALSQIKVIDTVKPTFCLPSPSKQASTLVEIRNGAIGYNDAKSLIVDINMVIRMGERVAITGDNGSGKSSLIKALLQDVSLIKSGYWHVINAEYVGYIDQHYKTLNNELSVIETIENVVSGWNNAQMRELLNRFLFRKNEEISSCVTTLSGGEKARLSLACIAAKTPQLLILDEVTNNIDMDTRMHIIQVLKEFPGALIVISHDDDFLREIGINDIYEIKNNQLSFCHK